MGSANGRHRRPRQAPAIVVAAGVTGSAIAIPLLGASGAHAADATTWDRVAECESGGAWSADFGNGSYGGLQLSPETWKAYGGEAYAERADLASRAQQIAVAEKVLDARGPKAWPSCAVISGLAADGTLPGSTRAPCPPTTRPGARSRLTARRRTRPTTPRRPRAPRTARTPWMARRVRAGTRSRRGRPRRPRSPRLRRPRPRRHRPPGRPPRRPVTRPARPTRPVGWAASTVAPRPPRGAVARTAATAASRAATPPGAAATRATRPSRRLTARTPSCPATTSGRLLMHRRFPGLARALRGQQGCRRRRPGPHPSWPESRSRCEGPVKPV